MSITRVQLQHVVVVGCILLLCILLGHTATTTPLSQNITSHASIYYPQLEATELWWGDASGGSANFKTPSGIKSGWPLPFTPSPTSTGVGSHSNADLPAALKVTTSNLADGATNRHTTFNPLKLLAFVLLVGAAGWAAPSLHSKYGYWLHPRCLSSFDDLLVQTRLRLHISALDDALSESAKENIRVHEMLEKAYQELVESKKTPAPSKIEELEKELRRSRLEIDRLKDTEARSNAIIEDLTANLEHQQTKNFDLEKTLERSQTDIKHLNHSINECELDREAALQDRKEALADAAWFQADAERSRREKEDAKLELKVLRSKLELVEEDLALEKKERRRAEEEKRAFEETVWTYQKDIKAIWERGETEFDTVVDELEEEKKKNRRLARRLAEVDRASTPVQACLPLTPPQSPSSVKNSEPVPGSGLGLKSTCTVGLQKSGSIPNFTSVQ
ncbi:hypothetical protein FRB90_009006, partial [Tulasnella sp. 427]